ncbi:alpha/beta hydrolase family protein [Pseudidiomarina andamanensis]|uniref:Alpha/beta hydrolase n=1 Tax=Pseudidiomarina andamanensis TaxID=1940690 RepID=A0AA92EQH0_9GAMM|nr:alpha/beta hydrolase [Pseudidiomarina andamanensis]MDS0218115.1 alpha/beta hydrolase [Pseudidiomarina andamanensis]QGT95002.1 alpha/beta hydrolase [Pseudidiomarina andamanensis]
MEYPRRVRIQSAPDRTIIAYHWHTPNPRGVIIMAPAMAVPQAFYQHFCQWLSEQYYDVISFDFYGIGASIDKPLAQIHTSVTDWATYDAAAVIDYAIAQRPSLPLLWFAHSISGQLFGMIPNYQQVNHMLTVATGSGFWQATKPQLKYKSWLLWRAITPWLIPLRGYFPGRKLGIIGDVPAAAMQQWRRWCLHPEYLVGAEQLHSQYAGISTPITALGFTDDEMLTVQNIQTMHDFYASAPQQRHVIAPADLALKRIGHFAVFRKDYQPHWQQLFGTHIDQAFSK